MPPGPRLTPTLASMAAVGGGLLAVAGLFLVLADLDGPDQRGTGLAISLLFTLLGVALMVLNRSTRATSAGVVLAAVGVIPMTVFLFYNGERLGGLFGTGEDVNPFEGAALVNTMMLATLAGLWLLAYRVGPGRRYGFFLGAALVALWLIPMNHIALNSLEDTFAPFDATSSFDSTGSFDSSGSFDSTGSFDSSGSFDSQFDPDVTFEEEDLPEPSDPTTKLGLVSLAFGAAYLGAARWRDRRGDAPMATAFLAPALVILYWGFQLVARHMGPLPGALLLLVIGAGVLAVGLSGQRRLSSWLGLYAAVSAVVWLVVDTLDESPRAAGGALTLIGTGIALLVGRRAATADPGPHAVDPFVPAATDPAGDASPWASPPPAPPTSP